MRHLSQPKLGLILAGLLVVSSFGFIAAIDTRLFFTWIALLGMATVPPLVIISLVWHGQYPKLVGQLSQPAKGAAYSSFVALIAVSAATMAEATIGRGLAVPTPPVIMHAMFTVIVTFWLILVWQSWPLRAAIKEPFWLGIAMLALIYTASYALFPRLFDFTTMMGTSVRNATSVRQGAFLPWDVVSFGVTTIAVMLFLAMLEFWPIASRKWVQPVFGLVVSVITVGITWVCWASATQWLGLDKVVFLVHGPVPFIFGSFFPLALFERQVWMNIPQPWRGIRYSALTIVAGWSLQTLYWWLARSLSGPLASGPPHYEHELWLATALLAITFPMIVIAVDLFNFWPFRRSSVGS